LLTITAVLPAQLEQKSFMKTGMPVGNAGISGPVWIFTGWIREFKLNAA
jgi:hypothetical protein